MKKLSLFVLITCGFVMGACKKEKNNTQNSSSSSVLMLKVDYLTNEFEGGIEYNFNQISTSFSLSVIDTPATDFGAIKVMYNEINQPLFHGSIVWMGDGEMKYPLNLTPATSFTRVITNDVVTPINGFENIFDNYAPNPNHAPAWVTAQTLSKAREYLNSNPNQVVKLFLYTPSVGVGNPESWDWIIFLKK